MTRDEIVRVTVVYASMTTEQLLMMQRAFQLDREALANKASLAFINGRLHIIDTLLAGRMDK